MPMTVLVLLKMTPMDPLPVPVVKFDGTRKKQEIIFSNDIKIIQRDCKRLLMIFTYGIVPDTLYTRSSLQKIPMVICNVSQ